MTQTLEQTEFNPKTVTWYKVLLEGKSCNGGNFHWSLPTLNEDGTYTPGAWHTHKGKLKLCVSGLHLTNNPTFWNRDNCIIFTCEVDENSFGKYNSFGNKIVVSKVRLISALTGILDIEGNKSWYKEGQYHRDEDLPAIEYSNGTKKWYTEGLLHRDNDLPAIEGSNGDKSWYKDGKLHRNNNLPAVIWADGTKLWYKNGKQYTPKKSK